MHYAPACSWPQHHPCQHNLACLLCDLTLLHPMGHLAPQQASCSLEQGILGCNQVHLGLLVLGQGPTRQRGSGSSFWHATQPTWCQRQDLLLQFAGS